MFYFTIEFFFIYFFWPYTLFLLLIFGLSILLGYIVHKMTSEKESVTFKSKAKKLFKVFLSIDLIPSAIVLSSLFIFPERTRVILSDLYWIIDHKLRYVETELIHHYYYVLLFLCFISSLILLAAFLQKTNYKPSIKVIFCYLLVSTPLFCGLFYLISQFDLMAIIILIGLPGALLLFL